jgi:cytochrome bd-type quinol oxidase subunit 2
MGNEDSQTQSSASEVRIARIIGGAALAAILVLTLSGNVKGEVERLWLFLVPPLCVLTAASIAPARDRRWLPLLALQIIQSILMAAGLAPLVRPI